MPLLVGLKTSDDINDKTTVNFNPNLEVSDFVYLIENAIIVNEGRKEKKSLLIENGKISRIADKIPHTMPMTIIDAEGLYLLPGIIDTHVHFRDPGLTAKADFETESRAALAGGVTSVVDMPNTKPQTTTEQTLDEKIQMASQKSLVNFGFMVGATNDNTSELLKIDPKKYVAVKLFMGSSTGNMLVDNDLALEKLFSSIKEKVIVVHCEDEAIIHEETQRAKMEFEENPPAAIHAHIRNEEACFVSTKKAVELAKKYSTRLHIAHVSTAKELSLFTSQNIENKNITAEVTPNHLWFSSDDYQTLGNLIRCNPSIKSILDRDALRKALIDGVLDTIATDHAPHLLEEKIRPYFSSVSGIPSIQHSLLMMLELVKNGVLSIEILVEKMCHNPSQLFDIEGRGFIREGYAADLVLVDLNEKTEINAEPLYYKCGWTPLKKQTLSSRVKKTFVNGVLMFDDKKGITNQVKGQPLKVK